MSKAKQLNPPFKGYDQFELAVEDAYYRWFQMEENHPDYSDEEVLGATNKDDIEKFLDEVREALKGKMGV